MHQEPPYDFAVILNFLLLNPVLKPIILNSLGLINEDSVACQPLFIASNTPSSLHTNENCDLVAGRSKQSALGVGSRRHFSALHSLDRSPHVSLEYASCENTFGKRTIAHKDTTEGSARRLLGDRGIRASRVGTPTHRLQCTSVTSQPPLHISVSFSERIFFNSYKPQ